jgi:hypothetical protein
MMTAVKRKTADVGLGFVVLLFGGALSTACPGQLCDPTSGNFCYAITDAAVAPVPVAPAALGAMTPIAGCARWPTLGAMDRFFVSRCGIAPSCHGAGTAYTDMSRDFAWYRLPASRTVVSCKGGLLVDRTSWSNSVLWLKTQPVVACPPGTSGMSGVTMPPQVNYDPRTPVLSLEESRCLEGFLRALAGQ